MGVIAQTTESNLVPATRPVIITCAVTGAIHTPSMSPHLPITPAQIAIEAIAAALAGAAIVHLHARDPGDGRPTGDVALFREFVPVIREACDVVVNNITTGGGQNMSVEDRIACAMACRPEMCSLTLGVDELRPLSGARATGRVRSRVGTAVSRRRAAATSSATPSPISSRFSAASASTARDSSSNATTLGTCTRWRISWTGVWSRRRCSCRSSSASLAGSAPTPTTCCTCGASLAACSATTWSGRCWRRDDIRWSSPLSGRSAD